jgi:signal transduction histidine kinase
LLKSSVTILLTAIFIILFGCNSSLQKKSVRSKDYDLGYYLWCNYKLDSAFLMLNRYLDKPDDTLKKGKTYWMMGDIQWSIGDLHGAQESLTGALRTLDPNNKEHLGDLGYTYNLLGNVSLDLKRYDEAIELYNKSTSFLKGKGYLLEVMNGKATALQKKGSYNEAVAVYDSILRMQPADRQLLSRTIDNRARTKWLRNSLYNALPEFYSALKIRTDSQYNIGLNASYAHLSEYYTKSNPDSALWYAQKMRQKASDNESPDDILEAIDKLIRLNNSSNLKEHLYEEYVALRDSLQFSRDNTRSRFAMIRYDVQKTKAEKLVLQQKNTKQQFWLFGLSACAIIVITLLTVWNDKRKKRIKEESENAIRNSKLKTSQKVHDVIANGLYGIMNELEHKPEIEKEPLITKIEGLYEKSRNISYDVDNVMATSEQDTQVNQLLSSFSNQEIKVIIVGNENIFWGKINTAQKNELYLVLREIMTNMKKHSNAKNVAVIFSQKNNKGLITYKDDGVGFPSDPKFGNGLNNTVTRIKSLNGEINFGKSEKGGASIAISFPLQSSKI